MTALQVEAIRQWVSGGGRLLIILGSNPLPAKHPLAQMLPLTVGEARRVTLAQPTEGRLGFRGRGPRHRHRVDPGAGEKGDWGWKLDRQRPLGRGARGVRQGGGAGV